MSKLVNVAMETVDEATRENGLKVCREYLGGTWERVKLKDFHMERIQWVCFRFGLL